MLAVVSMARDFCLPGKEQQEIRKRDFAVWFWGSMERDHEVVCDQHRPEADLSAAGRALGKIASRRSFSATSGSTRRGWPAARPATSAAYRGSGRWRCVQYWSHLTPYDQAAFDRWLDEQKQRYDLIATQRYPMLQDNDDDRVPEPPDRVEVYEFVPRA